MVVELADVHLTIVSDARRNDTMQMKELILFLTRAAAGDRSTCPAALDALWHRWLAFPKAYTAFSQRHVGLVVEHVPDGEGKCYAYAPYHGHVPVS